MTYTCPMHPEIRQPQPGKCPTCGMDLVPAEKAREHHHDEKNSYLPLIVILGAITAITAALQWYGGGFDAGTAMRQFMGLFFLTFGFFKTLNLRGFVDMYAQYDIVTKRFRGYGYAYPFIELALGAAYLAGVGGRALHAFTAAILAVGAIGVAKALMDKKKILCGCLGAVFKLPMSTVTLIEDIGMGLLALAMLLRP